MRIDEGPVVIRFIRDGPAAAAPNPPQDQQQQPQEENPDIANAQAAEQFLTTNTSSLGRRIGGALLIPAISNLMGSLLLRLSRRSHLLRGILGVTRHTRLSGSLIESIAGRAGDKTLPRTAFSQLQPTSLTSRDPDPLYPPLSWLRSSPFGATPKWKEMGWLQQGKVGFRLILTGLLGSSRLWVESDPVW